MMCRKYEVGADVLVNGYRSASNPRRRAAGAIKAVRQSGAATHYDVEASVDGRGLILIRGMIASELKCDKNG